MSDYVVSARKYRPLGFAEVVGQDHVTTTLSNAIENNKLAQALLFCGPRGVGKTTCARIVARLVNGYEDSVVNPLNIFELDAASNNSVDDIRSLTDQVRYPPQSGRYKVYIIDEVHMLSHAAFNAFLKTLEEPPPYAIFILATTEKHKVIPTILSRCQIFDFNRIQVSDIMQKLKQVADSEGVKTEERALYFIAQKADGALRDALSMFDLMVSFSPTGVLATQEVLANLHILDYTYYFEVVDGLLAENPTVPLLLFDKVIKRGFDGRHFVNGLSDHIRNLLVSRDARTVGLMEVPESIKEKYLQQATLASPSLLLSWLNIANQCDIHYKESKNQRLTVELALMKMAHVNAAFTAAENTPSQGSEKKKEPEPKPPSLTPTPSPPTEKTPPPAPTADDTANDRSVESKEQREKLTPDLKNLISGKNNHGEAPPQPSEQPSPLPPQDKPVSFDRLKEIWDEFAERYKSKVGEYHMLKQKIELDDNKVTVHLSNALEEPLLQGIKADLIHHLRTQLGNARITVTSLLKGSKREKTAYTNKEKFEALAETYPVIKTLKDRLGLDTDY